MSPETNSGQPDGVGADGAQAPEAIAEAAQTDHDPQIEARVEEALTQHFHYRLVDANGNPIDSVERRHVLDVMFREIRNELGVERFGTLPIEVLDQFAVMTIVQDHNTALLLKHLIESFMRAYAHPLTVERAYLHLQDLVTLSEEPTQATLPPPEGDPFSDLPPDLASIAHEIMSGLDSEGVDEEVHLLPRRSGSPAMNNVGRRLEVHLRARFPEHSQNNPAFSLRYAPDYIAVLAIRPLGRLIESLDGIPIHLFVTTPDRLL